MSRYNKYFNYDNIGIWQDEPWIDKRGVIDPLIQWLEANEPQADTGYVPPYEGDPFKHPYFRSKNGCIDLPEVTKYWADKGIRYTSLEQGKQYWISMIPEKAFTDGEKYPLLLMAHHEDCYKDPWWGMKTLNMFKNRCEKLAEKQDFIFIFLVNDKPDQDRIYSNVLQEATILYPIDLDRIYFDVSFFMLNNMKLKDVPGFKYRDRDGKPLDPDESIIKLDGYGIPAIDMSARWGNGDSLCRGLVMNYRTNEGRFDRSWFIHSGVGKRQSEALYMEYLFSSMEDDGFEEYWEKQGVKFIQQEYKGQRWAAFVPKGCLEDMNDKLPVMLVMQEVYHGNEHLAVTSVSYCYQFTQIAAQGDGIMIYFALEDLDSNDLLVEILDEAAKFLPIDKTRVYATGHSHDGYFALKFAMRNPDVVAAVATLGNPHTMETPEERGEPVLSYSDEELERIRAIDLPLINCNGHEQRSQYPTDPEKYEIWVKTWKRRLYAFNCPIQSDEVIRGALNSSEGAVRYIGLPFDRSESYWQDGVLHYIGDMKDNQGRWHLRFLSCENMPHSVLPFMTDCAWSFCRRFKRDPETKKIIELY